MRDLLTDAEDEAAARDGWGVYDVYDLSTSRWRVMVLGRANAEAASRHVIAQAKMGSTLCIKALQLVMKGVVPRPKGKRK